MAVMNFFKLRKERKDLKDIVHYARHVRHMHEDIADPQVLAQLRTLEESARAARRAGDADTMQTAGDALAQACRKAAPPRRHPKMREHVEVLFVAIAAAMAIRAYFFQPFKIPTGSMQPTLYGITVQAEPAVRANNTPARLAGLILFGERHQAVRAKTDGYLRMVRDLNGLSRLDLQTDTGRASYIIYVNDVPHKIPAALLMENRERIRSLMGKPIRQGDLLAGEDGAVKSGDYILVNRFIYNFIRPKRGDIAVFDTRALTHPSVRKDAYYIKRLVGLPGETISLQPPYLQVNGQKPADPRFDKIFRDPRYSGYQFTGPQPGQTALLTQPGDSIELEDDEYLFFGDNTNSSLDGRYFGGVKQKYIMGPAFFVCWPLDRAGPPEIPH